MLSFCESYFHVLLPFLRSYTRETASFLPHPPFFGFLEMRGAGREGAEIPTASRPTAQWLPWGLGEGVGEAETAEPTVWA